MIWLMVINLQIVWGKARGWSASLSRSLIPHFSVVGIGMCLDSRHIPGPSSLTFLSNDSGPLDSYCTSDCAIGIMSPITIIYVQSIFNWSMVVDLWILA